MRRGLGDSLRPPASPFPTVSSRRSEGSWSWDLEPGVVPHLPAVCPQYLATFPQHLACHAPYLAQMGSLTCSPSCVPSPEPTGRAGLPALTPGARPYLCLPPPQDCSDQSRASRARGRRLEAAGSRVGSLPSPAGLLTPAPVCPSG